MTEHNIRAYLVNTGWVGGPYGVGPRMDIVKTRTAIDSILDDSIEAVESEVLLTFNIEIQKSLPGMNPKVLNPRNEWNDKSGYDQDAQKLAKIFIDNFVLFLVRIRLKCSHRWVQDSSRGRNLAV